ncbi:hypothetical protein EPYR_03209 [Erwinia pyrifoliae DSM 12163]|nr:hypothetical protein EPYR_03209 [Erwinia pyrifoliae DSM 12163]
MFFISLIKIGSGGFPRPYNLFDLVGSLDVQHI